MLSSLLLVLLLAALSFALLRMRDRLAVVERQLEQERWVAEQVVAMGNKLESVVNQQALALRVLEILDEHLKVVCATLYALPLSGTGPLQLVASRHGADDIAAQRSLKQGVLAGCRDDHRVRWISPLPASYVLAGDDAEAEKCCGVVLMPLAFDHALLAVVELVLPCFPGEQEIKLLQQLADRIAGVLYGVRSAMRMEELLVDADDSRIQLKEKADELERVGSFKGRFLASMSHEIRTPMNAILGMGELLEETPLNADQREYLAILRNSGEGLLRIINDILDISKVEAGEMVLEKHPFDLLSLVERTCAMMAVHAHQKGLEILLHVDDGLPAQLLGDAGRLQQVLINLLSNAVKFTDRGEVALHLHLQQQMEPDVGGCLCRFLVEVVDSGIGIPRDKITMIFNDFTQADSSTTRRFGGTGLGLAICRQLVKKMDGELTVQSVEGEGSCFAFTMLLEAVGDELALPKPALLAGQVMLLVDDHAACRTALAELLSRWGIEVLQAADGEQALQMLAQRGTVAKAVDMLLVDCDLKGMDGFALAEAVKLRFPAVVDLLMMTTDNLSDHKQRAQQMGVELILTKPVRPSALLHLLLSRHPMMGAVVASERGEDQQERQKRVSRPLPKMHILIAEDDRPNQILVSRMMQRWGLDYTLVNHGQEALDLVQKQRFDLLLMDVNMPVMDGLEAARRIRAYEAKQNDGRHLPMVALTALAFVEDERKCLDAGMDAFLTKPIRQKVLAEMLWKMLDEGMVVPALPDPLLDNERALRLNDGDAELVTLLRHSLRDDLPQQMVELRAVVQQGACEQTMRAAHKLKGALATLGIERVQQVALALEKAARDGDAAQCSGYFSRLEELVERLQTEL